MSEAAEILAKEMQAIVAADRWKGRDLSAAPPEKWSHLRAETQQFWIDTASRILAAIQPADLVQAKDAEIAKLTSAMESAKPKRFVSPFGEFDIAELFDAVDIAGVTYIPFDGHMESILRHYSAIRRAEEAEAEIARLRADLEAMTVLKRNYAEMKDAAEAERDELRAAIFGGPNYSPRLQNGNFVEMVTSLHAAQQGGLSRAEKAEAERDAARAETGRVVEACATAIETLEPGSLDGSEPQRYSDETKFALMVAATIIRALAVRMSPHATTAIAARDEQMRAEGRVAGLREAAEVAGLNAWKHAGEDDYSRGMDAGAYHQVRACCDAIRALADKIEGEGDE